MKKTPRKKKERKPARKEKVKKTLRKKKEREPTRKETVKKTASKEKRVRLPRKKGGVIKPGIDSLSGRGRPLKHNFAA